MPDSKLGGRRAPSQGLQTAAGGLYEFLNITERREKDEYDSAGLSERAGRVYIVIRDGQLSGPV